MKGQKKDGTAKKSTKGIPRITASVIAMDEEGRKAWLTEKCAKLPAEQKKEVEARLNEALTEGRKPKKVNFLTLFKGRSVEELTEAKTALTEALEVAAIEGIEAQQRIIEKAEKQLAALKAAAATKTAAVA